MKDYQALDKRYLWHPFTQMAEWQNEDIIVIERGEGSYLIDTEGRRYLDGVSSLWVNLFGHRKREIDIAVQNQLEKITHSTLLGLTNIPAVELAEKLVKSAPQGLEKVFLSDNGATAVEVALKIAFQYWQHIDTLEAKKKTRFISFTGAYHGDTLGAVSVGGIASFHNIFQPLLFETIKIEFPYCYRCPFNKTYPECNLYCSDKMEETVSLHAYETAAVIVEPMVQGAAGMITMPAGFLRRIRDCCTRNNILLIADEVAVGFGRTGKMFACEHEDVVPDLMVLAKGITGGYIPIAATLTTERVYNAFLGPYEDFKTFYHGHSYTGNQLGCAAANAVLDIFQKEKVLETIQPKIRFFESLVKPLWELPIVGDIRQLGFMVGIELVKDRKTAEPFPPGEQTGHRVILEARKKGVIIRPLGDTIVLMPHLSFSEQELQTLVEVTHQSIKKVTENG